MKVDNQHLSGASLGNISDAAETSAAARSGEARVGDSQSAGGHDQAEASALKRLVAHTLEAGKAEHARRVHELSHAHRSGHYRVDAQELSRKIVDVLIGGADLPKED